MKRRELKKYGACHVKSYCSVECQKAAWKDGHKIEWKNKIGMKKRWKKRKIDQKKKNRKCGACHVRSYCSMECQKAARKDGHKIEWEE